MDPLLAVIVVLGAALLVVTSYMGWIGLMNTIASNADPRYRECHHFRLDRGSPHDECWRCRHAILGHPSRLIHH